MTGTFSSLNTALSALKYNRAALDIASSNIANASTPGYTRRSVIGQATGAPAVPALWSRWDGAGDGVEASSVTRMVDPVLDARSRSENASSSFLSTRSDSLSRMETSIGEPGENGVSAALSAFKSAWGDVANHPQDDAARTALLARAQTLTATVGTQAAAVADEWSDDRSRLQAMGTETGSVAAQLADLNRSLRSANLNGTDASDLLDQRDQLTARLAQLTGASVTLNADTTADVSVGGVSLVAGYRAATVTVSGSTTLAGAAGDPPQVSIDGTPVTLGAGEIGGTQQLLGTDLPGYRDSLDGFVAELTSTVNAQHEQGVDLDGSAGGPLFSGSTAADFAVAVTDPAQIAAAAADKGGYDNSNAVALGALDMGASTYRALVTGFGSTVANATATATNQAAVVTQVDASRESVSGVNTDEEMVTLLAAQHGYEGAAKVLTVMDSVLDTLIHHTGLVG